MLTILFYLFAALFGLAVLLVVVLPVVVSLFSVFVAAFPIPKVPLIYNLRNLQLRWLIAVALTFAIVLVITLMTGMMAFVQGMDRLTEESGRPGNILIMSDGSTDEAFSRLEPYGVEQLPQSVQVEVARTADGTYLFSREVFVIATHLAINPETKQSKRRFVQMRGIDNPQIAAAVHEIGLMKINGKESRWFAPTGEKEIVLGNGIARVFGADHGKPIIEPGDEVTIGDFDWKVVGVMDQESSSFGSEIWVRDTIVQEFYGRANSYSSFVVRVKDIAKTKAAAEALKKLPTASFEVKTEREYYAGMSTTSRQFTVVFYFITAMMGIGGVLGVMITMFAAVSQRAKDIGVLRLLGYARWQILSSFMLESLAIGLIGGILGAGFSWLVFNGWTVSSIVSSGPGGGGKGIVIKLIVDWALMGGGVVFAVVMAAIGGFLPAVFAMRLRPLESLR